MIAHEIAAILTTALVATVFISAMRKGSAAGDVIGASFTGASNLIRAVNSPATS